MKDIIRRIIMEQAEKQGPLTPVEIRLFKELNRGSNKLGSDKKILEKLNEILPFLSLPKKSAKYYLELYKANYRPEGDYQNLTSDEFVNLRDLPAKRTTNTGSDTYSTAKLPFKGSNLYGKWEKDGKGVEYYVIVSYNWYPIYLFKENRWYKAYHPYSSSTSKQMSNVNPIEYDSSVGTDVIFVDKDEMDALRRGATYENIMKEKPKKLSKRKEDFISKRASTIGSRGWGDNLKVKFKITDIREEGDKAVIDVTIIDAGPREGYGSSKMIPSQGKYVTGEIPGVTKEKVEKTIKNKILANFKQFVGNFPKWSEDAGYDLDTYPEKHTVKFNFIHPKNPS
jgi:hypothetical protein